MGSQSLPLSLCRTSPIVWHDDVPIRVGDAGAGTWLVPPGEVGCQPGDLILHLGKALARSYHTVWKCSRGLCGHGKGDRGASSKSCCSKEKEVTHGAPLLGTPTPLPAR